MAHQDQQRMYSNQYGQFRDANPSHQEPTIQSHRSMAQIQSNQIQQQMSERQLQHASDNMNFQPNNAIHQTFQNSNNDRLSDMAGHQNAQSDYRMPMASGRSERNNTFQSIDQQARANFNEENDVYEISSLFDDVRNSQGQPTMGATRDDDPGNQPVVNYDVKNEGSTFGAERLQAASSGDQFTSVNQHYQNSNFVSEREDYQSKQYSAATGNVGSNTVQRESPLGSARQEQYQDQFMEAMEGELRNIEKASQQNNHNRTDQNSIYNQSQHPAYQLNQAHSSQSKEALFQTPKINVVNQNQSNQQINQFHDNIHQKEPPLTQVKLPQNLYQNDCQQQMAAPLGYHINKEGHMTAPVNPHNNNTVSTVQGTGGQFFDTPNQSYNFNERNMSVQDQMQNHEKYQSEQIQKPQQMIQLNKDEENAMVDWINSFDDPYLVLVSGLPLDLLNGVTLSHLVGYIACSPEDREKIFELLHYPKDAEGMMALSGGLMSDELRENFDLAYNVLRYSQAYQEADSRYHFLDEQAHDPPSPESMAGGNLLHIIRFLEGVQSIYFALRSSRSEAENNMPLQTPLPETKNDDIQLLNQDIRQAHMYSQDQSRPTTELGFAEDRKQQLDYDHKQLLASEGAKLQNDPGSKPHFKQSDFKEYNPSFVNTPAQDTMNANQMQVLHQQMPKQICIHDQMRPAMQPHHHLYQNDSQELDELQRLEMEEQKLMEEIHKVDKVVEVMREDFGKIRLDQLQTEATQGRRFSTMANNLNHDDSENSNTHRSNRSQNRVPRTMSNERASIPQSQTRNSQRMYSQRYSARRNGSGAPMPSSKVRSNSYRANSVRRQKAYQESMNRPLIHQNRRNSLQRRLLDNMDYANVIRKSYSRPLNSKTTDQLVIEDTPSSCPESQVTSPKNPRNDPAVSHMVRSVHLPVQQAHQQSHGAYNTAQTQGQAEDSTQQRGRKRSVEFVDDQQNYDIPQDTFGFRNYPQRQPDSTYSQRKSDTAQQQRQPEPRHRAVQSLQDVPRPPPKKASGPQDTYQKLVQEKKDIQVVNQPRNFGSFTHPLNENLDEIMGEMQTLKIQPTGRDCDRQSALDSIDPCKLQESIAPQATVTPVDWNLKLKILEWLTNDVRLLKPMTDKQREHLLKTFHQFSRTGVMYADLVNRLNGRNEVIKGIYRNPPKGNYVQLQANYKKIMKYFKEFPKFCPRYLWSADEMIQGNSDVLWGFFDDIWHWHFNKVSPFDPAAKQQKQVPSNRTLSTERPRQLGQPTQNTLRTQNQQRWNKSGRSPTNYDNEQFQESMPKSHKNQAPPLGIPRPTKSKIPQFDQNQLELLQPRSILPSNMVFEQRSQSVRNNNLVTSQGTDANAESVFHSSLAASGQYRSNLKNSPSKRKNQMSLDGKRPDSEKRLPNPNVKKSQKYAAQIQKRNSRALSKKGSNQKEKSNNQPRSNVEFDFGNKVQQKPLIEPFFNESSEFFEMELNLLNGKMNNKKANNDQPLQYAALTKHISPILKNKQKRQHKFDANSYEHQNNQDLENIPGLFNDVDEDCRYDQMMRSNEYQPKMDSKLGTGKQGQIRRHDIYPSQSSEYGDTYKELVGSQKFSGPRQIQDMLSKQSKEKSPGIMSDAGVLGFLDPQQPINYDFLDKQM